MQCFERLYGAKIHAIARKAIPTAAEDTRRGDWCKAACIFMTCYH
jgi:hypothetical protein